MLASHWRKKELEQRCHIYSDAYCRAIAARSAIYVDILVISEFTNVCVGEMFKEWKYIAKDHYKKLPKTKQDSDIRKLMSGKVKDFRNSVFFETAVDLIGVMLDGLVTIPHKMVEGTFTYEQAKDVVEKYKNSNNDFNDVAILEICRQNSLTLITDDQDFAKPKQDVRILTANKSILEKKSI